MSDPSFLLDISTLAECFRSAGEPADNYIRLRLAPEENTRYLLLGNIANLFLDEWIHAGSTPPRYGDCMKKAFRLYALELTACPDLQEAEAERAFFADCRLHFDHIRRIVTDLFPAAGLDPGDAVLEPSYTCPALGLQGRLDYMQRDRSALVEMKSGKADEYTHRGAVLPRTTHLIQMMLYRAMLQCTTGAAPHTIRAYLLYTRYPLLLDADPSDALMERVLQVRDRIVEGERLLQQRNDPDYTAARLGAIGPLHTRLSRLTPAEQRYFYTLYNFITKEQYLAKTTTPPDLDPDETTLTHLRITANRAADTDHPTLCFARRADDATAPDFRTGDAVALARGDAPADHIAFRGTIDQLSDTEVVVTLRAAQRNPALLAPDHLYTLRHDRMDTSFHAMYRGLAAFLDARPARRRLLLNLDPPRFDPAYDPRIACATDDFRRIALRALAARDYFLLVGPPGTGKTSRALRSMVEALLAEGQQILLTAYTNRAVDEICKAVAAITPAPPRFIRMGREAACDPAWRPYLADRALADCRTRDDVRRRLAHCPIIVGTVSTLASRADLFRLKHFDVAIVDEATQILEPQLLPLLCRRDATGRHDAIDRFILIGDHKQLPAVVQQTPDDSRIADPALRALGLTNLRHSLFERLYRSHADPRAVDRLHRQGRMNQEVADFPNRAFYGGHLSIVGLPHQQGALTLAPALAADPFADLLTRRVAFLPAAPQAAATPSGTGFIKYNHGEAGIAADLAAAIYRQYAATTGFTPATLGIITPYRSQIALIRRALAAQGIPALREVTVDTVERFQGSERDVIIYSFCVNSAAQLALLANLTEADGQVIDRKLNVVLTRARCQIFLVGAPELLRLNPIYARLLDHSTAR